MKRRWPWSLGIGFLLVIAGFFSVPFFAQFPATRDFGWTNFLILLCGATVLGIGLVKAFRQPHLFRGKVLGSILSVVALLVIGMFVFGILYIARVPAATAMPKAGDKAPEFEVLDEHGRLITLANLLSSPTGANLAASKGALLIFYRGHW